MVVRGVPIITLSGIPITHFPHSHVDTRLGLDHAVSPFIDLESRPD
jgi:hypothetical protein